MAGWRTKRINTIVLFKECQVRTFCESARPAPSERGCGPGLAPKRVTHPLEFVRYAEIGVAQHLLALVIHVVESCRARTGRRSCRHRILIVASGSYYCDAGGAAAVIGLGQRTFLVFRQAD